MRWSFPSVNTLRGVRTVADTHGEGKAQVNRRWRNPRADQGVDASMASFRDLLNAAKARIREVDTAEADEARRRPGAVVLDVREPDEYEQGAIPGALHI